MVLATETNSDKKATNNFTGNTWVGSQTQIKTREPKPQERKAPKELWKPKKQSLKLTIKIRGFILFCPIHRECGKLHKFYCVFFTVIHTNNVQKLKKQNPTEALVILVTACHKVNTWIIITQVKTDYCHHLQISS